MGPFDDLTKLSAYDLYDYVSHLEAKVETLEEKIETLKEEAEKIQKRAETLQKKVQKLKDAREEAQWNYGSRD